MVAAGKWKLYSWHERPDLASDLRFRPHSSHYQSLQQCRSDTTFLPLLRHMLAYSGHSDVCRLSDDEILDLAAHQLMLGKIYLVQDGVRLSLEDLYKAVKSSDIGKKFIQLIPQDQPLPILMWGSPANNKKGEYTDDNHIVLNQAMKEKNVLSDCQWKQVITMELGNAANQEAFDEIYSQAENKLKELYSKGKRILIESQETSLQGAYADSILTVELRSRNAVIEAFLAGDICKKGEAGLETIFPGGILNMAAYKGDARGQNDWKAYTRQWTQIKDDFLKNKK